MTDIVWTIKHETDEEGREWWTLFRRDKVYGAFFDKGLAEWVMERLNSSNQVMVYRQKGKTK